jgi:hypothetical protein
MLEAEEKENWRKMEAQEGTNSEEKEKKMKKRR